jgi:hypothetical protein
MMILADREEKLRETMTTTGGSAIVEVLGGVDV